MSSSVLDVFTSGEGGYSCFRIPALLRTPSGGYALFAEGRNKSCSDYAPTDIVLKTSANGRVWSNMTVLCPLIGTRRMCSDHDADYGSSAHNPSPLIVGGKVMLVFEDMADSPHTRLTAVRSLDDAAQMWNASALDLTAASGWYARGLIPGAGAAGISLPSGRILLPVHSDHWNSTGGTAAGAGMLISDDNGGSWRTSHGAAAQGNENAVALAPNGSLIMLMRLSSGWKGLSWSHDEGDHWSAPLINRSGGLPMVGASCEGSLLRIPGSPLLIAATPFNPSGSCGGAFRARCNMTTWVSADSGATWQLVARAGVETEDAAYSTLAPFNATHLAVVYERGYAAHTLTWTLVPLPPALVPRLVPENAFPARTSPQTRIAGSR